MDLTYIITIACGWLFITHVVRHLFRNSSLPPEGWLMICGIAYAMIQRTVMPGLPEVYFEPDLILVVILPLLIFESGRSLQLNILRLQAYPILFFAIIGTIISTIFIGVALYLVSSMHILDALLFGAALSATDVSAVMSILKKFKLKISIEYIVEGEALLNDSIAITLFTALFAIIFEGHELNVLWSLKEFLANLVLSIGAGAVMGLAVGAFLRIWDEHAQSTELSFSIILAYSSYLIGVNVLDASGIITALSASIFFIMSRPEELKQHEQFFDKTWSYICMLLESFLFFALGVETGAYNFPIIILLVWGIGILVLSRMVVIYGGSAFLRLTGFPINLQDQNILFLAGLRGALTIALILLVPEDYEYRFLFLSLAYVMILVPLMIQAPLMKYYLDRK